MFAIIPSEHHLILGGYALITIGGGNHLVVIAPHGDDESLGCGGLINRWNTLGGKSTVILVNPENKTRIEESQNASKVLGFELIVSPFTHPEGLDGAESLRIYITYFEDLFDAIKPMVICVPNINAYHQDHRISAMSSLVAMRPNGGTNRWRPPVILEWEYAGDIWPPRTHESPNFFVALSEANLGKKVEAYEAHKSQLRMHPSERSSEGIAALAKLRGAQSGSNLAEAYRVLYSQWV